MGLFNFFMKGVGFSDKEENKQKKQAKASTSVVPEQPKEKYSNFRKHIYNLSSSVLSRDNLKGIFSDSPK